MFMAQLNLGECLQVLCSSLKIYKKNCFPWKFRIKSTAVKPFRPFSQLCEKSCEEKKTIVSKNATEPERSKYIKYDKLILNLEIYHLKA